MAETILFLTVDYRRAVAAAREASRELEAATDEREQNWQKQKSEHHLYKRKLQRAFEGITESLTNTKAQNYAREYASLIQNEVAEPEDRGPIEQAHGWFKQGDETIKAAEGKLEEAEKRVAELLEKIKTWKPQDDIDAAREAEFLPID